MVRKKSYGSWFAEDDMSNLSYFMIKARNLDRILTEESNPY